MEAFLGSWKLVKKPNFDQYMEALGLPSAMKQYGNNMAAVVNFSQDGDKIIMKIKTYENTDRVHILSFRLGEEFDEVTIDFRSCKSVYNLEQGKLVQLQKWDGNVAKTISEIQDGKLITTFTFRDVVSSCVYERT